MGVNFLQLVSGNQKPPAVTCANNGVQKSGNITKTLKPLEMNRFLSILPAVDQTR